jgi:hypothetical protein
MYALSPSQEKAAGSAEKYGSLLFVNPKNISKAPGHTCTHLMAAGPHISCLRGTIIMNVLASTTL